VGGFPFQRTLSSSFSAPHPFSQQAYQHGQSEGTADFPLGWVLPLGFGLYLFPFFVFLFQLLRPVAKEVLYRVLQPPTQGVCPQA